MPGSDRVAVTLRVPPDVHASVAQLAADQRRSINEQYVWIVELHLLALDGEEPPDEPRPQRRPPSSNPRNAGGSRR